MPDHGYKDRQNLEIFAWPELMQTFTQLVEQVMVSPTNLSLQLRSEIFTMASVANRQGDAGVGAFINGAQRSAVPRVASRFSINSTNILTFAAGFPLGYTAYKP